MVYLQKLHQTRREARFRFQNNLIQPSFDGKSRHTHKLWKEVQAIIVILSNCWCKEFEKQYWTWNTPLIFRLKSNGALLPHLDNNRILNNRGDTKNCLYHHVVAKEVSYTHDLLYHWFNGPLHHIVRYEIIYWRQTFTQRARQNRPSICHRFSLWPIEGYIIHESQTW